MVTKKGFSLIELTVVIGLLGLLILAISSTLLMSIISSNRIRTITRIKQAGNYATGQIQSMLRSAKSISSCVSTLNSDTPSITVINRDGGETLIINELIDELNTNIRYQIASKSGSISNTYLTPTDVSVSAFSLICEPNDIKPTLIHLAFDLQDVISSETTTNPTLHFETSINLRNE